MKWKNAKILAKHDRAYYCCHICGQSLIETRKELVEHFVERHTDEEFEKEMEEWNEF